MIEPLILLSGVALGIVGMLLVMHSNPLMFQRIIGELVPVAELNRVCGWTTPVTTHAAALKNLGDDYSAASSFRTEVAALLAFLGPVLGVPASTVEEAFKNLRIKDAEWQGDAESIANLSSAFADICRGKSLVRVLPAFIILLRGALRRDIEATQEIEFLTVENTQFRERLVQAGLSIDNTTKKLYQLADNGSLAVDKVLTHADKTIEAVALLAVEVPATTRAAKAAGVQAGEGHVWKEVGTKLLEQRFGSPRQQQNQQGQGQQGNQGGGNKPKRQRGGGGNTAEAAPAQPA